MPTKTEQADLLMAMYGRHGECPIPILAPRSPADCFEVMIEAFQIAIRYMTPVIVLSDGAIANGAELVRQAGMERARRILRGSSRLFMG